MKTYGLARRGPLQVTRASSWCSRRPRSGTCNPALDLDPPPDRPDPSIYSQGPLLAAGATATWHNPDIVLYAAPQYVGGSYRIDRGLLLDNALITVRNRSATAAAINTVVAVSYSPFGIGMPLSPLATQMVSLRSGEARQLSIPLPKPREALSLFVDLSHPYDADVTNNHGASSSALSLLAPGLTFPLQFGNVTRDPITYNLSVEPNTVGVTLNPAQVTVAPGSTAWVDAIPGALPGGTGTTSFTIVARDAQGNLAGGFTWLLYW